MIIVYSRQDTVGGSKSTSAPPGGGTHESMILGRLVVAHWLFTFFFGLKLA